MPEPTGRLIVAVVTPLDAPLVDRIRTADQRLDVRYEPELLPPVRYPSDHRGDPAFRRTAEQEHRWQQLLHEAHVLFGVPGDDPEQLAHAVRGGSPQLRFVQGTAAGAGEQVAAAGLSTAELDRVAVTSASGVHAGPLAEFALLGLLAFARGLPRLQREQAAHRWEHYPTPELAGRTIVVLGVGAIGARIAVLAKAVGMYVIGVNASGRAPEAPVDEHVSAEQLPQVARRADALVVTLPATAQTVGMVDATVLESLRPGAIIVNVGRGKVIDEQTLIQCLRTGHLAGAALDVTAQEPLPATSPLWALPNVLLSPHTAALSPQENDRIVDLFIDNLNRLLTGRELRNSITAQRSY